MRIKAFVKKMMNRFSSMSAILIAAVASRHYAAAFGIQSTYRTLGRQSVTSLSASDQDFDKFSSKVRKRI